MQTTWSPLLFLPTMIALLNMLELELRQHNQLLILSSTSVNNDNPPIDMAPIDQPPPSVHTKPTSLNIDEEEYSAAVLSEAPVKSNQNKQKHARNEGGVFLLFLLSNSCSSQLFPCVTDEGMHHDVHVMDIEDSESESQQTQHPNKKTPSADVDHFF